MANFRKKSQQFNVKLGEHLKTERTDQRYTMRALADKLETPHSFIGKIEQNSRRLDVGEFVQYCKALDIDPTKAIREVEKLLS